MAEQAKALEGITTSTMEHCISVSVTLAPLPWAATYTLSLFNLQVKNPNEKLQPWEQGYKTYYLLLKLPKSDVKVSP